MKYPTKISHWVNGREAILKPAKYFNKIDPATEKVIAKIVVGKDTDIDSAVQSSEKAFVAWSKTLIVDRSKILRKAATLILERKEEIAEIIAKESGKPMKIALGEVVGASQCGMYLVNNLEAFKDEVLESTVKNRKVLLRRQSIGVGALITPYNNPMAGVAWKTFPALLCGNTVIMKAHEDTPYVPIWFAKILDEAGLPAGVFNVIQGGVPEIGAHLVEDPRVKFISFTGSLKTGRKIIKASAERLAKVSIEAGGKNPFVVCDDADLEKAANFAIQSSFVDAGQRCAAASRIIIVDSVYGSFKEIFLGKVTKMTTGVEDEDSYGATINLRRTQEILNDVKGAIKRGATLLCGGNRAKEKGFFLQPTVLENVSQEDEISHKEIFGPVIVLYRVKDLNEAIKVANNSEFKLSGAIHTKDMKKADKFIEEYRSGVVRINGPTHGSEPNMPFGGVGLSGNGWREPGLKALDFYSDWRQISTDL